MLVWLNGQPTVPVIAPDFEVETTDEEHFVLSDYRGQVVVINFWATWCGPCLREIPEFSEFATQNPEVQIIGIAVRSNESQVRALDQQLQISYPLAIPSQASTILDDYGMTSGNTVFPTTFIIDAQGQIVGGPIRQAIDYGELEDAVSAAIIRN